MEKIKFKLAGKMEELATQMEPAAYAQIQIWERFRDKINELVEWGHGVDRQLTELYQQQEQLLQRNKMGYWKPRRKEGGD